MISLITIFTIPKPFKGHIAIIQENAINSWKQLHPDCEIILYGDEFGIKEICEKYSLSHVSAIEKTEFGTPTLNYIFKNVQESSKNSILCYINCDIILLSDVITTINRIPFETYLLVGKRRDIEINTLINFEESTWESHFRDFVKKNQKSVPGGIDYLIFPKGIFYEIPPFAVGRAGWDNWMVYNSRKSKIRTIDATQSILAIHQNHSYSHVPQQTGTQYLGPESDKNFILCGSRQIYLWNLDDTNWIITETELFHKKLSLRECFRLLIIYCPTVCHPFFEKMFRFFCKITIS